MDETATVDQNEQGALERYARAVSDPTSVYFVAEAGVNHNGDVELAEDLVDVAAESGADAVKFQTFRADRLVTRTAPQAGYQRETAEADSQFEMLQRYELDRAAHEHLQAYCTERNLSFLSTPFDRESADLLDALDVPLVKLGSGELDNHPLLGHVAALGRPMIVSTGMGTMDEVHEALEVIRSVDPDADVAFLHCVSAYPTAVDDVNLRAMETMAAELPVPVGYSDHTQSVELPGFAVAAGANIVEKHFTLDNTLPGPDHRMSLEPDELARAVSLARTAATARGEATKRPTDPEPANRRHIRKGLHAAAPIAAGDEFTADNVAILRPAEGLAPPAYDDLLGQRAATDLEPGDPITEDTTEG